MAPVRMRQIFQVPQHAILPYHTNYTPFPRILCSYSGTDECQ